LLDKEKIGVNWKKGRIYFRLRGIEKRLGANGKSNNDVHLNLKGIRLMAHLKHKG